MPRRQATASALDGSVPPTVAAALAAELAGLSPEARRLLDAAAVVGDPFEPGLAAAVAERAGVGGAARARRAAAARARAARERAGALRVPPSRRPPRRLRRRAGRLAARRSRPRRRRRSSGGAPARCSARTTSSTPRRPGDAEAIALLTAAAEELQSPAPPTAARFYAGALRLVPEHPDERARRIRLQSRLADAQAAGGDARGARDTLLAALRDGDGRASGSR